MSISKENKMREVRFNIKERVSPKFLSSAILFIITFILLNAKLSSAFLSPGTLTLVANSIGSFIWGIIIIIIVNITLLFKHIKKKGKITLTILSLIIIILLLIKPAQRYNTLKTINQLNNEPYQIMSLNQYLNNKSIETNKPDVYNLEKVGLSTVTDKVKEISLEEAYDKGYKILCFHGVGRITLVNCTYISSYKIIKNAYNRIGIDQLMHSYNITRGDKITLVCDSGHVSAIDALILKYYGYNTTYAKLYKLQDLGLIKHFKYDINRRKINPLIDRPIYRRNKKYIYFLIMSSDDELFIFPDQVRTKFMSIINNITFVNIEDNPGVVVVLKGMNRSYLIKNVSREDIKESDVLCKNKLHCFLTKEYLNYLNVSVNKIYCLNCE